jgi:hypothetical protein
MAPEDDDINDQQNSSSEHSACASEVSDTSSKIRPLDAI